eukprot:TRINITY_DN20780_c0_g1_i1.p3 TRINITY_DN20780_c0_g1~~TRINITY_DN20780_c0_g1_i1.p3  ORF type:complete len:105 (-),score=17.97 TRINITY_DN20780_c0_g1_i1:457-771(-)
MSGSGSMLTASMPNQAQGNDKKLVKAHEAVAASPPLVEEEQTNEQVRSRLLTISQLSGVSDAERPAKLARSGVDEAEKYRQNLISVSNLEGQRQAEEESARRVC